MRQQELRALRWEHVHAEPDSTVPPHIEVWRSVRSDGDTKTKKSRRTLALPARCIEALRKQRAQQAADRLAAGERWRESGLVFTTALGTAMDAANVRRGLPHGLSPWSPVLIRRTGPRESYRTLSCPCCRTPECRSRRSPGSLVTAERASPSWSTATRSGLSSRPARPPWIGSSHVTARARSYSDPVVRLRPRRRNRR